MLPVTMARSSFDGVVICYVLLVLRHVFISCGQWAESLVLVAYDTDKPHDSLLVFDQEGATISYAFWNIITYLCVCVCVCVCV